VSTGPASAVAAPGPVTAAEHGSTSIGTARDGAGRDGATREAVARLLLERGPVTAVVVAESLGLSVPAVRRHLDALLADGQATYRDAPRRGPRGRGRPARQFVLSDDGRARFGHAYDDLAVAALRFLAEQGGQQAVDAFARRRVAGMIGPHRDTITSAVGAAQRAHALAGALTAQGYAASAREVTSADGVPAGGAQLCQHHCPVAHVAAEFPQLCEAETAAFADLLGIHVQRLATIARGDAACTTHIPGHLPGQQPANPPGRTRSGVTGDPVPEPGDDARTSVATQHREERA
jgi:predicted ArsR family transcriptional regulator